MKNKLNRAMTLLLTLSLVLSLFVGIATSASAASYPKYNTGKVDQVCTSLSSFAKNYYTGSYTYENLSKQNGNTLKSSISALVTRNRHTGNYNDLKKDFQKSDSLNGNSGKLHLIYCGYAAKAVWEGDSNYNREHMWPHSLHGSAAEGDLHSMRPADKKVNSFRSNYAYGNANGGKAGYADKNHGEALGGHLGRGYFEPLDNVKGDVARTIMYDYCTYSALNNLKEVFESSDVLLQWMASDPVDEFEMSRNDVIEGMQGCRNPFVDYPELAFLVFGKPIPKMTTPSGNASGGVPTPPTPAPVYKVTAKSNDNTLGTVTLKDNVITAVPKEGCEIKSFTVDPEGAATVKQSSNNKFTVTDVKKDCTVTINFEKIVVPAKVTVTTLNKNLGKVEYKDGIITATPKEGYEASGFEVNPEGAAKVTQDGNVFTVTEVKEDCTITIYFTKIAEKEEPVDSFTDCPDGWYRYAINFVMENNLMGGVGTGLFAPEGTLTRGMIVTVLYRNADSPEVTELSTFTDVSEDAWYAKAVAWAEDNNVVNGVGDGLFAPEYKVTRDQIATILYRYAKADKVEDVDLSGFSDAGMIEEYATDAMNWAVSSGLLRGDGNLLKPLASATRAEFATMIMRFLEK